MIGEIVKVAAEVIGGLVALIADDKKDEAEKLVERFHAATPEELDADKQSAVDQLRLRFATSGPDTEPSPPASNGDEVYGDLDDEQPKANGDVGG